MSLRALATPLKEDATVTSADLEAAAFLGFFVTGGVGALVGASSSEDITDLNRLPLRLLPL
jgi:hypothetical protein